MKKKKNKILPIIVLLVILILAVILIKRPEKSEEILAEIDNYKGYTRVISQEEYEFYKYFVERDLPEKVSEEEFERLIREYAGEVNAAFYLGNQLGLCEPYSFAALEFRMEQENVERQVKLAEGEVVYGVEQFTLETYFLYTLDNLQTVLMSYLEENADKEILKMAENYYEEHKEEFRSRTEVVYEQTEGEQTEVLTADADTLNYLGKADPGLADFLGLAQVDDVYKDITNDLERRIVLKEITYSEDGYKNHKEMALYRFVRNELYDVVIDKVAKNNPVEFE